jgi:uncharacterized coiled-coil protein SlyX
MKINMLSEEIKMKADRVDLDKLRTELKSYTDKECNQLERILTSLKEKFENIQGEVLRNKADFDQFRTKEYNQLEARVTALEKRIAAIIVQI